MFSSLPATLLLIRRPTIYTEIFRLASRGQDIILTCLVDSLSNHTAIMWTKDDVPLEITNRYRVSHTHRGREFNSNLVIPDLRPEDFGHYGCFAVNEVGNDYARIVLKDDSDSTATKAGVSVGICLGIAAMVIIFLALRKKLNCCSGSSQVSDGSDEEKMTMKGF